MRDVQKTDKVEFLILPCHSTTKQTPPKLVFPQSGPYIATKPAMARQEPQFEGWLGLTADSVKGKLEWKPYTPKKWEETDVDIKISHCGICWSDIAALSADPVS